MQDVNGEFEIRNPSRFSIFAFSWPLIPIVYD
jgi:hypothetical protein